MNRWFFIALADAIAAGNSGGSHGAMQENAHLAQPAIQASQSKIKVFFLLCVIVAGAYGAWSVSQRILFVQAAPAALALILLWLS